VEEAGNVQRREKKRGERCPTRKKNGRSRKRKKDGAGKDALRAGFFLQNCPQLREAGVSEEKFLTKRVSYLSERMTGD